MAHVREDCDLEPHLQRTLLPNEKEALLASEHRPNFILRIMAEVVWQADLMEGQMLKTPIPLSYTRHTSRFSVLVLLFSLWPACGGTFVPASGIISFLLLSIEEIGVQIEEPFGNLPIRTTTGQLIPLWLHNVLVIIQRADLRECLGRDPPQHPQQPSERAGQFRPAAVAEQQWSPVSEPSQ
ncbi:g2627 [Coccomyxa viridis]|uniref:G2627 protein n=1 Tax=Coccomyxa viridis TaxID=1274662 RepID=A0ABP1FSX8_9CHLO